MMRTCVLMCFVAAVHPLAQQSTFRSSVETVRVDVLATRDGRPVMGLTAADFEIRDNGVLRSFETSPMPVVVICSRFNPTARSTRRFERSSTSSGIGICSALTPAG
jgi:hypothetical protein